MFKLVLVLETIERIAAFSSIFALGGVVITVFHLGFSVLPITTIILGKFALDARIAKLDNISVVLGDVVILAASASHDLVVLVHVETSLDVLIVRLAVAFGVVMVLVVLVNTHRKEGHVTILVVSASILSHGVTSQRFNYTVGRG